MHCVIPENIHTSPTEGVFSKTSPPLWKFKLSFIHFFKFFGLTEPPPPPGNSNPFCGGSMDIFWNCTFSVKQKKTYLKNLKKNVDSYASQFYNMFHQLFHVMQCFRIFLEHEFGFLRSNPILRQKSVEPAIRKILV